MLIVTRRGLTVSPAERDLVNHSTAELPKDAITQPWKTKIFNQRKVTISHTDKQRTHIMHALFKSHV